MADTSLKTIRAVMKCVDRLPGGGHVDWGRHAVDAATFNSACSEGVITGTIERREDNGVVFHVVPPTGWPNARAVDRVIWKIVRVEQQTDGTALVDLDGIAAVDFTLLLGGNASLTLRVPEHQFNEENLWAGGGCVTGSIVQGGHVPGRSYDSVVWFSGDQPFVGITDNQDGTFTVEVEARQPY